MPSNREALASGVLEAVHSANALIHTFESFAVTLREFHDRLDGLRHVEDLYRDIDLAAKRDSAYRAIAAFEQAFLRARVAHVPVAARR